MTDIVLFRGDGGFTGYLDLTENKVLHDFSKKIKTKSIETSGTWSFDTVEFRTNPEFVELVRQEKEKDDALPLHIAEIPEDLYDACNIEEDEEVWEYQSSVKSFKFFKIWSFEGYEEIDILSQKFRYFKQIRKAKAMLLSKTLTDSEKVEKLKKVFRVEYPLWSDDENTYSDDDLSSDDDYVTTQRFIKF